MNIVFLERLFDISFGLFPCKFAGFYSYFFDIRVGVFSGLVYGFFCIAFHLINIVIEEQRSDRHDNTNSNTHQPNKMLKEFDKFFIVVLAFASSFVGFWRFF